MYKRKKGVSISKSKSFTYNGVEYKSGLEAYMAKILTEEGLYFRYEGVTFTLQDSFDYGNEYWERQSNGKGEFNKRSSKVRSITYVPDFIGEGFIIETKGYANESFPIKYKMFKNLIKDLDVVLYKPQNQSECDKTLKQILSKEIWKSVKDFSGYEVSSYGRVRRIEEITELSRGRTGLIKGKILKQTINTDGYAVLHLYKDGKKVFCQVHRLVMLAFYPELEQETVNHIDENKQNNGISNLEWLSKKDNIQYSKNKPVLKIDSEGIVIKEYRNMKDTLQDGYNPICVSRCCRGMQEKSGGFRWEFKK
jgi:hypothetical protein